MQPKINNEWDDLFKNKFEDAEITPSANVWDNIEANFPTKKRRKVPIFWWSAACIILVSTTLLIFEKKGETALKNIKKIPSVGYHNNLKENLNKANISLPLKIETKKIQIENITIAVSTKAKPKTTAKKSVAKDTEESKNLIENHSIDVKISNGLTNKLELPASDTLLVANVLINKSPVELNETVSKFINKNELVQAKIPKKKIKNLGDAINFLVNKIDKREKKLIKFDSNEDNNSSIVALNIGIIQFNSKNSTNN